MKLSDLNKLFFFLNYFYKFQHFNAENEIDIWKKNNSNELKMKKLKSRKKKFRVH